MDSAKIYYFLMGGESLRILTDWQAQRQKWLDRLNELAADLFAALGAKPEHMKVDSTFTDFGFRDTRMQRREAGIEFKPLPEGWKICVRRNRDFGGLIVLDTQSKKGKATFKEMLALRPPLSRDLFAALFPRWDGNEDFRGFKGAVYYPGWEPIGEQFVVSQKGNPDKPAPPCPPGATPLKASEYWALKERATEAGKELEGV